MYRLVVPVDDDVDHAVAQAAYITNLPGEVDEVDVTVVHAYDDTDRDDLPDEESPGVRSAVRKLREAGVAVETREIYSPVAAGIVDLASELDADEIVMSGQKRSPAGKALFGSVTQSVLLDAPMPVTVVTVG